MDFLEVFGLGFIVGVITMAIYNGLKKWLKERQIKTGTKVVKW